MKLEKLLGSKDKEIWTSKRNKKDIDLRKIFCNFVRAYNLEVFEEKDGLLIASDDSGQMLYKKILDFEWLQWKPFNVKNTAKSIFDMTGGHLLCG